MGIMTRMRDHAHIFIISFAVVFIAFWVVSDVDLGSVMQGSMNEIGSVNGKSISYQEFTRLVEQVAEAQKQQNGGKELDENQITTIREQVWNDYITQAVVDQAVKDLGLSVQDKEVTDWVRSDRPPEILAQHFKDSTGKFNRDAYRRFLAQPGADNEQALVQIEQQLRSDLLRQKLTSALSASFQIPDGDVKEQFLAQNRQFNVNYIAFDPNRFAAGDTAAPTNEEYQAYYNAHKHEFRTEEMSRLEMVLFPDVPSSEDSAAIRTELESILKEANAGKDFLELIKLSSEAPHQDAWMNPSQVAPNMASVFTQPVGSIVGPMPDGNGLSLIKVLETREGKDTYVLASHILIRAQGEDPAAKQKAESIMNRLHQGENFAALASQFSDDKGSAVNGGDLGWFGKGRMVKAFEEAAFAAKVGETVGPVKTDYGFHIIRVQKRSNAEVKYATLRMAVKASSGTRDQIYERARNFAYFASENGFEREAGLNKYEVRQTGEFERQPGGYIPEVGVNSSLMKFAFEGKVGEISEVHRATNGYVVARIAEQIPAGYRSLDQVKEQIKEMVKMERRLDKTMKVAQNYASKLQPGQPLQSIVPADSSIKMVSSGPFTMAQGIPTLGRDLKILGRITAMKEGEISKPIRGQRNVCIVHLVSKSPFDENVFKLQREDLRRQQQQQRQSEFIQAWLEKMKEKIDIVDNRDRFFK